MRRKVKLRDDIAKRDLAEIDLHFGWVRGVALDEVLAILAVDVVAQREYEHEDAGDAGKEDEVHICIPVLNREREATT